MATSPSPVGSGARPQVVIHPSKHWSDRKGASIRAICLHHTAGTNSLQWLTQNPNQVSTHVLISKLGVIYRMVPDEKAANAAGFSNLGAFSRQDGDPDNANQVLLHVEIENRGNGKDPYTPAQYWACGWQICQWWNAYNPLYIISHALIDTQGKNDPYALDLARIYRETLAHYDH